VSQISDEILDNIDIVDVVWRYVTLKRAGANFSGLCPFHNEKTPSFMVSPQKQIFKCFGCGVGGNVITFMKEIERIDFWDAVKILAKDVNIDITEYQKKSKFYEKHVWEKEKIKNIHRVSSHIFINSLQKSEKAQAYLTKQRKLSDELIKQFEIGFAPDNHYDLIQELKEKWFSNDDLLKASIVKKSQNGEIYSFFRNRIVFPIHDTMNNVVGFSARILDPKDKPKYLNSSEHIAFEKSKILYGLNFAKKNIKEHEKLIIVEWQMDVIALHRLWFPVGIATCGTALTEEHIKLIKRYTENIYLLFDNDSAGQEATIRALKIAYQHDIFPKIIRLEWKLKDVDDIANLDWWKEIFEQFLSEAKDWFLTIFGELQKSLDMNSPIDKKRMFDTLFGMIIWLPNASTQSHYLGVLADKIWLNYEIIKNQFIQYTKWEWRFFIKQQQKKTENSSLYQLEREIIVASLFFEDFFVDIIEDPDFEWKIRNILWNIKKILVDSELVKILTSDEDKIIDKLKEAQLRREKELNTLNSKEDKISMIKKVLQPSLKKNVLQINKNKSISTEDKQIFLQWIREFLK